MLRTTKLTNEGVGEPYFLYHAPNLISYGLAKVFNWLINPKHNNTYKIGARL